jgi:hypothetical protein
VKDGSKNIKFQKPRTASMSFAEKTFWDVVVFTNCILAGSLRGGAQRWWRNPAFADVVRFTTWWSTDIYVFQDIKAVKKQDVRLAEKKG